MNAGSGVLNGLDQSLRYLGCLDGPNAGRQPAAHDAGKGQPQRFAPTRGLSQLITVAHQE